MGFTARDDFTMDQLNEFLRELWEAHIGRNDVAHLLSSLERGREQNMTGMSPEELRDRFTRLHEALAVNPVPDREWRSLLKYFKSDDLIELLQVSDSSIQRYVSGKRPTPDDVAGRLHWLALVVGHLSGSYNPFGVRRWFARSRAALGGKAPQEVLLSENPWSPDGEGAQQVEALAKASTGMPAT